MDNYGTHDLHFDPGADTVLTRNWLAEELRSKPAHLKLLITDTCSENVQAASAAPLQKAVYADVKANAQFYAKNLFLEHRGLLDITAASPGQLAYGDSIIGGHFTSALAEALIPASDTNGDDFLSWDELFDATRAGTEALYKETSATFSPAEQRKIQVAGQTPFNASLPEPTSDRVQSAASSDSGVSPVEPPVPPRAVTVLNFTSVPSGAEVLIDGDTVGRTPLTDYELDTDGGSPKVIEVTVKAEGYEDKVKTFRVQRGEPLDWEFELKPTSDRAQPADSADNGVPPVEPLVPPRAVALLNFTSVPPGAEVSIDGGTVGRTPLTDYKLDTDGGSTKTIEVTVKAEGYAEKVKTFRVQRGEPLDWEFELKRDIPKTIRGQDGKIHALLILGSGVSNQEDMEKNQETMTGLLRKVSHSCEVHLTIMKPNPEFAGEVIQTVLVDSAVTSRKRSHQPDTIKPSQVKAWIQTVSAAPVDTLLVYYSGHGMINKYGTHNLHFDLMADGVLTRDWLAEELQAKPAGLKMLITDTTSYQAETAEAPSTGSPKVEIAVPFTAAAQIVTRSADKYVYRKLFLEHSGFLDITAASPGQFAYSRPMDGGFFTNALVAALTFPSDTNQDGFFSWQEVFADTRARTESLCKEEVVTRFLSKVKGQTPVAFSFPERRDPIR